MSFTIPTWALRLLGGALLLLGAAGAFGAYQVHRYLYASAGQINGASVTRAQLLDVLIAERFSSKSQEQAPPVPAK